MKRGIGGGLQDGNEMRGDSISWSEFLSTCFRLRYYIKIGLERSELLETGEGVRGLGLKAGFGVIMARGVPKQRRIDFGMR